MSDVVPDVVSAVIEYAAALPVRLRAKPPRVHCITNTVAQAFTANTLLAAGATPSVTTSVDEIAGFVASADNLLVNLGTLDGERREAIAIAVDAAVSKRLPWVLDPVFVDRSPPRLEFARTLIARRPAVIRLNAAELAALTGEAPSSDGARKFAKANESIVALSGEVDIVTDGVRLVSLHNGDELMGLVTAMGCAGSAFVAASLAVDRDRWLATASAMMVFGLAGELAADRSDGPGSLAFAILDVLHGMTRETILQDGWAEA
ncbi:hydroxyethylthiazole kinase [Bradyrhizobium sp. LHD-71]|uniref:hydroxyethylthiazole kinase n=1 Tax=Bradyrhizobium sp. LHD-71 TaxID=3072141 RepID=UPI0028103DDC|nr:hydroxyethylthiazole kinase [Bradyrhizobium sp. LHD-71]MDQ8728445.1 hydroxyethylthiazole kinase [Bradyrhizobium sp. LHD-71]